MVIVPVASSPSAKRGDENSVNGPLVPALRPDVYRDNPAANLGDVELSNHWHQASPLSVGSISLSGTDTVAAVAATATATATTTAAAAQAPSIFGFALSMIPFARGEELRTDHTDSPTELHSFFYGALPRSQADGERLSDRTQLHIRERTVLANGLL